MFPIVGLDYAIPMITSVKYGELLIPYTIGIILSLDPGKIKYNGGKWVDLEETTVRQLARLAHVGDPQPLIDRLGERVHLLSFTGPNVQNQIYDLSIELKDVLYCPRFITFHVFLSAFKLLAGTKKVSANNTQL